MLARARPDKIKARKFKCTCGDKGCNKYTVNISGSALYPKEDAEYLVNIWNNYPKLLKELARQKKTTGLFDTLGREIMAGNVVHWTDGGDDLTLAERVATRWDRIAVVGKEPDIQFKVFDSPHFETRERGHSFGYGNFIYKDTEKYLTVVAVSVKDYRRKFISAAQCMAWVLKAREEKKNAEVSC